MAADGEDRRAWVHWAADCAQRVLPLFERHRPDDDRPRRALAAARAWVRGDLSTARTRATAFAAYAAAREVDDDVAARAAALAGGHAAAAVHVAAHARRAADEAVVAAAHATPGNNHDAGLLERHWQDQALPRRLRPIVDGTRPPRSA
nr:Imm5 family immunity protein [uncultured Actinotalea sp.]